MCFIKDESNTSEGTNANVIDIAQDFAAYAPAAASYDDIINEENKQEHAEKDIRDEIIEEALKQLDA